MMFGDFKSAKEAAASLCAAMKLHPLGRDPLQLATEWVHSQVAQGWCAVEVGEEIIRMLEAIHAEGR